MSVEEIEEEQRLTAGGTPAEVSSQGNCGSSNPMNKAQGKNSLWYLIKELHQFTVLKRNVRKEVKHIAAALLEAYAREMRPTKARTGANEGLGGIALDVGTQTSPPDTAIKTDRKRLLSESPNTPTPAQERRKRRATKKRAAISPRRENPPKETAVSTRDTQGWTTVPGRKVKKTMAEAVKTGLNNPSTKTKTPARAKPKAPRRRERHLPDAIIIKKKAEQTSYVEILRQVKGDPTLKEVGDRVSTIRRTATGNLLLVLGGKGELTTTNCGQLLRETLREEADVATKVPENEIILRGLDEASTKEDVGAALTAIGVDTCNIDQIKMVKGFGGTQSARIRLPVEMGKKALTAGRIRVGWVSCRVQLAEPNTRCFRCWGQGHVAARCKSEVDRRGLCFKCRGEGHMARECKAEPNCALCPATIKDRKHLAGSSRCPTA